jgi:threonine synthase
LAVEYISTRGQAPVLDFEGVLLAGLATDGGLYVPREWPQLDFAALAGRPYADVAAAVFRPFVGTAIDGADLTAMIADAYSRFAHAGVAPLRQTGPNDWIMELFHGPTLAFKDVALQLLGRLFDHVLKREARRITIVGATSGDTGSAAIEGCRGRDAMDIFILYPHGRVSEVQRRQMTTVPDANVHCLAVEGSFDDCQAIVKALFNDPVSRQRLSLSAVNSINWARVMAQIVYYVTAVLALGPARQPAFVVPTGNFGDIYAGYAARRMGVPAGRLVAATNRNDILARFFATGDYRSAKVEPTMSPSMDIQVSSNFERLLLDLLRGNGAAVTRLMADMATGGFAVAPLALQEAHRTFDAGRSDEEATLAAMRDVRRSCGFLIDPHTAVGMHVAGEMRRSGRIAADVPLVTLSTAHPAKFPDAVERATGERPVLPPHLADLMERKERFTVLPNDFGAIRTYITERARAA